MYEYNAEVLRVVDGDTIDFDVDLGFGIHIHERFRLLGIDAWEKRGAEKEKGLVATKFVEKCLAVSKNVRIVTAKDKKGKYGRYLAEILITNEDATSTYNLNDELIKEGHAVPYGEKK